MNKNQMLLMRDTVKFLLELQFKMKTDKTEYSNIFYIHQSSRFGKLPDIGKIFLLLQESIPSNMLFREKIERKKKAIYTFFLP